MRNDLTKRSYVGSLTSGALLRAETKILSPYLLQNLTAAEWKELFEKENPLQKNSVETSMRYMRTIRRRIEQTKDLKESFLQELVVADQIAFSQLMLLLILLDSPIVVDFMCNILGEYRRRFKEVLPSDIWDQFIEDRKRYISELGVFADKTLNNIGATVIKVLSDVGYLSDSKTKRLQAVYPTQELYKWLKKLNRAELKEVFECTL